MTSPNPRRSFFLAAFFSMAMPCAHCLGQQLMPQPARPNYGARFRPLPGIQKNNKITKHEADSLRMAIIRQELNLSQEENARFSPALSQYLFELETLDREHFAKVGMVKKGIDRMSDQELTMFMNMDFDLKQRKLNVKKQFYQTLRSILPLVKVAHYYVAEDKFARQLIRFKIRKSLNNLPDGAIEP